MKDNLIRMDLTNECIHLFNYNHNGFLIVIVYVGAAHKIVEQIARHCRIERVAKGAIELFREKKANRAFSSTTDAVNKYSRPIFLGKD